MKTTIASIAEFTWDSKKRTLTAPVTKWHKIGSILPDHFQVHGNTRIATFSFTGNKDNAHVYVNTELDIRLILTF